MNRIVVEKDPTIASIDHSGCVGCELCVDCKNCKHCVKCMGCNDCTNCVKCTNCKNCVNCEGLVNKSNKRNMKPGQQSHRSCTGSERSTVTITSNKGKKGCDDMGSFFD